METKRKKHHRVYRRVPEEMKLEIAIENCKKQLYDEKVVYMSRQTKTTATVPEQINVICFQFIGASSPNELRQTKSSGS